MIQHTGRALLSLLIAAAPALASFQQTRPAPRVSILQNDATSLVVSRNQLRQLPLTSIEHGKKGRPTTGARAGEAGKYWSQLVLLPHDSSYTLSVETDQLKQTTLRAPAGTHNSFATVEPAGWWRGFRLGRLLIHDFIQRSGFVATARSVKVTLSTRTKTGSPQPVSVLESRMLRSVLNSERAGSFRRPDRDTPDCDAPGELPAVSIFFRTSGIYQLTFADLATIDARMNTVDPAMLQLFAESGEIPLLFIGNENSVFEPGEAFWFYGERLSGPDGAWFDDETELQSLQLKIGRTPGARFRIQSSNENQGALPAKYFRARVHFEEEKSYYSGDDDSDIFTSDRIEGEGWVWQRLLGGAEFTTEVILPNVEIAAPTCSLRVKLRGITKAKVRPNHHVQAVLNGHLVGDIAFSDNETVVLRSPFSASLLKNGSNTLQIKSVGDTGADIDQIYLDWAEIDYWRTFVAANHQLSFNGAQRAGGDPLWQRYQISNFHEPEIKIINSTAHTVITPTVIQTAADQFSLIFADSTESASYFAFSTAAIKKPDSLRATISSDWFIEPRQADFIIITHPEFLEQAEQLADYRRHRSGLSVAVITTTEIYDTFSNSRFTVEALRRFLRCALHRWQRPAPHAVVLLGDASWDPKMNADESSKRSFVPSFGNPVADNRLVCLDGPDDFLPDLDIGRIPVENVAQAQAVINKIMAYEAQPLQDWSKNFTFLNGGINDYERALFLEQSERLIATYAEADPMAGQALRLYKTTDDRSAGELQQQILGALETGTSIFTFSGHAGSRTWELMLVNDDVKRLQNRGRLPFIASMTCHTARFAHPVQSSFGEDFLRVADAGAIAFWGTSGWGFVLQDGILLDGLFQAIMQDSVRTAGSAVTRAKMHLIAEMGTARLNQNVVDQYTLLGDPTLRLNLPTAPDLVIAEGAIRSVPGAPTEQDTLIDLRIDVRNRGLRTTDSLTIAVDSRAADDAQIVFQKNLRIGPVGQRDSLRVQWPGRGRRGAYTVSVEADTQQEITESDETNNSAASVVYFYSSTPVIASPRTGTILSENHPALHVYNPETPAEGRQYQFELSTSATFTDPDIIRSGNVPEGTVRTSWSVPGNLEDGDYFWRSRAIENGVFGQWKTASFFVRSTGPGTGFLQKETAFTGSGGAFSVSAKGATLPRAKQKELKVQVQSGGFYDLSRAYLIVNGEIVNESGRGHNVVALDPVSRKMIGTPRVFDTNGNASAADSLALFLEKLPERTILLAGIRDDGSHLMNERAHKALESFGSQKSRNVGLRDSWALVGAKGMPPGQATEVHKIVRTGLALASDTLRFFQTQGEVLSPAIGPATAWRSGQFVMRNVAFNDQQPGGGVQYNIAVQGRKSADQSWQTLSASLTPQFNLSEIDADRFPWLRLVAHLEDDDGLDSPRLTSWRVHYQPKGDLVLSAPDWQITPELPVQGDSVTLRGHLYFFSETASKDSVDLLFAVEKTGEGRVFTERRTVLPFTNNQTTLSSNWSGTEPGSYLYSVTVDPDEKYVDAYTFNNYLVFPVQVQPDTTAPRLAIFADDHPAVEGQLVDENTTIRCVIYDENPAAYVGPENTRILIDGDPLSPEDKTWQPIFRPGAEAGAVAEIHLQAAFEPGRHSITFEITDANGNTAQTQARLEVAGELELRHVLNYPNPFSHRTTFSFQATRAIERVEIKVYTVAGRLIRVLEDFNRAAGHQSIEWDGRDADGDPLANGIYLYKISAFTDGKSVEAINKVAISH